MTREDNLVGQTLDNKYRIHELLGKGGMGAVYLATHLGTKRTVAVKVIKPEFVQNSEFIERFKREAEAAGRLRHPNVVDVTDFGFARAGSSPIAYLVMEYLDGCTLADVLKEEIALPLKWVVDIMDQVCSAVEAAHQRGIIHRDLKPENIWLEPNQRGGFTIKVLDFGLAKVGGGVIAVDITRDIQPSLQPSHSESEAQTLFKPSLAAQAIAVESASASNGSGNSNEPQISSDAGEPATKIFSVQTTSEQKSTDNTAALTRVGSIMGTPHYMSPEQSRGEPIDGLSDIYSIAVITYRMLAGTTPFTGEVDSVLRQQSEAEPPKLKGKRSRVPRRISHLVSHAMAKNPASRPQSAAGFASALKARAVGPAGLLQRAVALYSEHFPAFIRMSFFAHIPFLLIITTLTFADSLFARIDPAVINSVAAGILVVLVLLVLLAYSVLTAVAVPVIVQLSVLPLRPVRVRDSFRIMKSRFRPLMTTSLLYVLVVVAVTYILSSRISSIPLPLPGVVSFLLSMVPSIAIALCMILFGPVVILEGISNFKALWRASKLTRRAWVSVLIISVIQLSIPIVVGVVFKNVNITITKNSFGLTFSFSGFWSLAVAGASFILINPLLAIITALLYLKTRQAGGETLPETLDTLGTANLPKTKWQALMSGQKIICELLNAILTVPSTRSSDQVIH